MWRASCASSRPEPAAPARTPAGPDAGAALTRATRGAGGRAPRRATAARHRRAVIGLALVALSFVAPSGAGPAPAAPPAPEAPPAPARQGADLLKDPAASPLLDRHYLGVRGPAPASAAADPAREVQSKRFQIVAAAGVRPGMRVADFGVGQGLVTALFARAVGSEGTVYGVGSAPDLPQILKDLARQYHVANLVPVASTGDEAALPAGGVDLAFLGGGLRQFTDPRAVLAAIHRALIPYGTLIIVAPLPSAGPGAGRGAQGAGDRDSLLALARQAGFRLVDEPGLLRENAFLRFERGDTEDSNAPGAGDRPSGQVDTPAAAAAPPPPPPAPGSAPPAVGDRARAPAR